VSGEPGAELVWDGEAAVDGSVAERRFGVRANGRQVPGLLWLPDGATGPRPLVLIGHGACRHKRSPYVTGLARRVVQGHGFAAAAIDAPAHGDRRADPDADDITILGDFLNEWIREGSTDDMVADWRATLASLRRLEEVGDGPLGYWGLSMGTIYGLPFSAQEPRVQVAVFGLMGIVGPSRERLTADAPRISCPVLFIQQWDDQLIPRPETLELFDALGSIDKRLHAHPGDHTAVPVEEMDFSVGFLARHLAPADFST
jgi:dienelactone hydrolase